MTARPFYTVQRPDGTCLMVCEAEKWHARYAAVWRDGNLNCLHALAPGTFLRKFKRLGYRVVEVERVVGRGGGVSGTYQSGWSKGYEARGVEARYEEEHLRSRLEAAEETVCEAANGLVAFWENRYGQKGEQWAADLRAAIARVREYLT